MERKKEGKLGLSAINATFAGTRPRVASPLERRKLREDLRDTEDRLRALEQAEKEDR